MFKKVEGHNVLINAKAVNATQMKLVEDMLAHYRGMTEVDEETKKRYESGLLRRSELKLAHGILRGRRASPYFIAKNQACQVKNQHGIYDLTRLKLAAGSAAKETEAAAAAEAPKVKKTKKIAAKKEAGAKKEAKVKKGQKQIEAPAPSEVLPEPAAQ